MSNVSRHMERERPIELEQRPDALEVRVRAVCGALLGAVLALGLWSTVGPFGSGATSALVVLSIVSCSFGAMKWGNPFWHKIVPWLRAFY
jgi:CHASE2 domain-containing sensor protein